MRNVGIQEHLPLFLCKLEVAAILAWSPHLCQDVCEYGISLESHGCFQFAYVILVLEHGLCDSMFFSLSIWFCE